jgi:peptidoglycan/LPS O-acetylase OafA/YrhL
MQLRRPGIIVELDGLRGLGAIAVLLAHLPRGFVFGQARVDLFFVLSGFLITGIIIRGLDSPQFLRTFYLRRAFRTFPIYYLSLFVVYALNAVRHHPSETHGFSYYLFYLQNIQWYWGEEPPHTGLSLEHTWTLAIEEQFYLFWPSHLLLLTRLWGKTSTLYASLVFLIAPVILRTQGLDRFVLLGHSDGLALGSIIAYLYHFLPQQSFRKLSTFFASVAAVAFPAYFAIWWQWQRLGDVAGSDASLDLATSIICAGYFGLLGFVVANAGKPFLGVLRYNVLGKIGRISYGLYLYHWIIYEALDDVVQFRWNLGQPYWLDVFKIVSSFGVASASWNFIEQPILALRERYTRRASAGEVPRAPITG